MKQKNKKQCKQQKKQQTDSETQDYNNINIYQKENKNEERVKVEKVPTFRGAGQEFMVKRRKLYICYFSKVHQSYNIRYDSLFLAIKIMDEYCKKYKNILQLNSTEAFACLMLALKYQQIYYPSMKDLQKYWPVYLMNYLKEETTILKTLNYNLNLDGPHHHFNKFTHLFKASNQVQHNTYFMLEIAMTEPSIVHQFTYQQILKSIQILATPPHLIPTKSKSLGDSILNCIKSLCSAKSLLKDRTPFIYQKYSKKKYCYFAVRQFPALKNDS